jgi:hypothetical protein
MPWSAPAGAGNAAAARHEGPAALRREGATAGSGAEDPRREWDPEVEGREWELGDGRVEDVRWGSDLEERRGQRHSPVAQERRGASPAAQGADSAETGEAFFFFFFFFFFL